MTTENQNECATAKESDERFCLLIENISSVINTWKELKDFIRCFCRSIPFRADLDRVGFIEATGSGRVRVYGSEDDATNIYGQIPFAPGGCTLCPPIFFSFNKSYPFVEAMKGQVLGGQKLQVTLFTAHDGPAAKRKGDLSDLLYYESSTGQFWVPISPVAHLRSRYPNPALARVCAGSAPESSSSQSWTDSSAGGNISDKKPSYTTTSSGNLVNITKGAFRTEARSIHISNLPHGTKAINLQQFLDESGLGGKLIMSRSSAKDSATVCYESCEKARKAVEAFDQNPFRGKRLRVKLDTETIQVAREEPKPSKPLPKPKSKGIRRLVVDGSTPIP